MINGKVSTDESRKAMETSEYTQPQTVWDGRCATSKAHDMVATLISNAKYPFQTTV